MDDAVHVIVLRGAGEKFFCAGADIQMLQTVTPRFKYFFCLHANETLNAPRADAQAGDRGAQRALRRAAGWRSRWRRTCASRARARARSACPR